MFINYEAHQDIMEAATRERRLKNWCRKWKLNLIEQFNPMWVIRGTTGAGLISRILTALQL